MSRLFETLCVKQKKILHLDYHNQRMNESRNILFSKKNWIDLKEIISLPENISNETYRCKVVYARDIEEITFTPYEKKKISRLKLISCDSIDYRFKWEDREIFHKLLENEEKNTDLIILKNNCITDCTYANLAFFDGREWLTPIQPLLKGTKRQRLLDEKKINPLEIHFKDLKKFCKVSLINAMLDLEEMVVDSICID